MKLTCITLETIFNQILYNGNLTNITENLKIKVHHGE